ncbi:MAG: DUF362 domain-containing protein [Chitinispirillaceae bacterium]|nr:DUF362 domain-containing protein [Chitinispirillaceae bacterium]
MSIDRRSFLKTSVAGAAGLSVTVPGAQSILASAPANGFVWTDKMPINPDIDNMRVICMHDPLMYNKSNADSFSAQNKIADEKRVYENLDKMAMALSNKTTADDAWKTIFRSSKAWADTKVMVKINTVSNKMQARAAIVKKIVDVLIGFGVQPKNIVLFDGQGGNWKDFQSVTSLTDDTKIRGTMSNKYDSLGGRASISIPDISSGYAPKDLVDGVTDIIVNIAVNKGHDSNFNIGKTTLCLKNHFGTFLQSSGMAMHLHSTNGLININKIAATVGGNPVRQQLCIIDSIWAAKKGPDTAITHKPDRIVMGTFAGAVDYCCVKKIREEIMNVTNHETEVIPKFLTSFGYKETDPVWVEMTPETVSVQKVTTVTPSDTFSFTLTGTTMKMSTLKFALPKGSKMDIKVRITDLRGRLVREIANRAGTLSMMWDGAKSDGSMVPAGSYAVSLIAGTFRSTMKLTVLR